MPKTSCLHNHVRGHTRVDLQVMLIISRASTITEMCLRGLYPFMTGLLCPRDNDLASVTEYCPIKCADYASQMLTVDTLVRCDNSVWQVRGRLISTDSAICQGGDKVYFIHFLSDVSTSAHLNSEKSNLNCGNRRSQR